MYCADAAVALGEDPAGSAPKLPAWLLLEQPGPWGHDAVTQSDLDPGVAAALTAAGEAHGIRVGLIRRSARRAAPGPRRCFLVSCRRGAEWIEEHVLDDPAAALDLDLAALGAGRSTDAAALRAEPLYTVCTHGERDACCSRLGRPLYRALAAVHAEATWQCSHTGGHRFAPTFLAFPHGFCFGHVPAARGRAVVDEYRAGRIALEHFRGRSGDSPPAQAADALLRRELGLRGFADLTPAAVEGDRVALRRADGSLLEADVAWRPTGEPRPTSCGKAPADPGRVALRALR